MSTLPALRIPLEGGKCTTGESQKRERPHLSNGGEICDVQYSSEAQACKLLAYGTCYNMHYLISPRHWREGIQVGRSMQTSTRFHLLKLLSTKSSTQPDCCWYICPSFNEDFSRVINYYYAANILVFRRDIDALSISGWLDFWYLGLSFGFLPKLF